jgi:outer membrane protease
MNSEKTIYGIDTLEGKLRVKVGDWIATGANGEHWPIADVIFKKTYVEVTDDEQ